MQNVSDLPIAYIQAVSVFSTTQQNKGTAYVIIWLAMYVVTQFNCGLFQLVEWDFNYTDKYYNKSADDSTDIEKNDTSSVNTGIDASSTTAATNEKSAAGQPKKTPSNNADADSSSDSYYDDTVNIDDSNMPNMYTAPTITSASTESPISPTSSVASSYSRQQQQQPPRQHDELQRKRSLSNNLNPRPLTLVTSKISQLSRANSRTSAIARIPSARNMNQDADAPDNSLTIRR
ncbi:hypothetical protein PMKS-003231 [Pichia membranifaciens]|uniref:Uncharacterized protein n=1 Tax=Pichia membranifaciens TaxID=4926 RepID=A0A1Q2YJK8_9ASCO|nr:hypothetical protein PMKS-003231 [Pichia membranifaciens]